MAAISCDWNNHLLIFFVLGKDLFESVRHIEKVILFADFTFKKLWLHLEVRQILRFIVQSAVNTHGKVVFLATIRKSFVKIEFFSVRIDSERIDLIVMLRAVFSETAPFNT